MHYLDFENQIAEIEGKIEELRHLSGSNDLNIVDEVTKLQSKVDQIIKNTYSNLTPWQKTLVARHPERPHALDYINEFILDFIPLAGDRVFGEDLAIVGGIGRFEGNSVVIVGTEKGFDTDTRVKHNFGMARPEGYRKAQRLMSLAEQFKLPIIFLVDTTGAYPGVDAEARGQAEAIARAIETSLQLKVPSLSVIIGEGGSGGAIALATTNTVLMLEHAVYSVISPEGCASILWRDGSKAQDAASALKITAQDMKELGIIDKIIKEPHGGAHRDTKRTIESVRVAISESLNELNKIDKGRLQEMRKEKFLAMGKKGL